MAFKNANKCQGKNSNVGLHRNFPLSIIVILRYTNYF